MTDPLHEPRSFQPAGEQAAPWEAARSSALLHRVRWHTGLTQAEFAAAFRIDLERLRALERGSGQADSALAAYLAVIDRAPDIVRSALNAG